MGYIIFGCGAVGREALGRIGANQVLCFASNYDYENRRVCGKSVISFTKMVEKYHEDRSVVIVIASGNYHKELEAQTCEAGVSRYFVYQRDAWPGYLLHRAWKSPSCSEIVKNFHLNQYRRIGVYGGANVCLPWADAIQRLNRTAEIFVISADGILDDEIFSRFPTLSLDAAEGEIDCLCVAISRWGDPAAIRDRFLSAPPSYAVADFFDIDRFEPEFHYEGIEKYKDIHKGERIFIIGNGPSLTIDDLNTLHRHGEICMGFNKVYRAYDRTPWRADYLAFSDMLVIEDCEADIPSLPGQIIMADTFHFYGNRRFSNVVYYHMNQEHQYSGQPAYPNFSDDPCQGMYLGYTVVYDIGIQLAAYMGAKEIYLLGVDNSMRNSNVASPENHFISDYNKPEEAEKRQYDFFPEKIEKAYEKAELYSRSHGFRIFNATRGGKVEAFERVDFDSLF